MEEEKIILKDTSYYLTVKDARSPWVLARVVNPNGRIDKSVVIKCKAWGDDHIKPENGAYLLNKNESYVLELDGEQVWLSSPYYDHAPMTKVMPTYVNEFLNLTLFLIGRISKTILSLVFMELISTTQDKIEATERKAAAYYANFQFPDFMANVEHAPKVYATTENQSPQLEFSQGTRSDDWVNKVFPADLW